MATILKSTKQEIFEIPSMRTGGETSWPANYRRYLLPNKNGAHHIQIIHNDKVRTN